MSAITVTPKNISADFDRGSDIVDFVVGAASVAMGDVVYLDSNNQLQKAIATSSAAAQAIGIVVGVPNFYAETTAPQNSWAAVCVHGLVFGFTGLVSGQPLYVSKTTAGGLDTAVPASGAYSLIVGNAEGSDSFFVRPGQSAPASV